MLAWANLHYRESLVSLKNKLNYWCQQIIYFDSQQSDKTVLANVLSTLGILLLFVAFFVTKESRFPGKWALLPVLASVLLITSGKDSWFNKYVLSNRVLVWLGLISYPMYLWHWPLLSMARIIESETPAQDSSCGFSTLYYFGMAHYQIYRKSTPIWHICKPQNNWAFYRNDWCRSRWFSCL